jgi:hypothetical protein
MHKFDYSKAYGVNPFVTICRYSVVFSYPKIPTNSLLSSKITFLLHFDGILARHNLYFFS